MPTPVTDRLSDRIHRYQARDTPHSVDINGVIAEVQALERKLGELRAELQAQR